jgi:hypothetical protein
MPSQGCQSDRFTIFATRFEGTGVQTFLSLRDVMDVLRSSLRIATPRSSERYDCNATDDIYAIMSLFSRRVSTFHYTVGSQNSEWHDLIKPPVF